MAEYLLRQIAPDATTRDRIFTSEDEANREYDNIVASPNPATVARVVLYVRGFSTPHRSDDIRSDGGPIIAPPTAGPEPLNTEGHVLRALEDAPVLDTPGVTVSETEQIDATPVAIVPDTGRSQGAVTVLDPKVPDAVIPAEQFPTAFDTTETREHDTAIVRDRAAESIAQNADPNGDSLTEVRSDDIGPHNEQTISDTPGFDFRTGDSNVTDTDGKDNSNPS